MHRIWRIANKCHWLESALSIVLCACTMGPDYLRPYVEVPSVWRIDAAEAADISNIAWWDQFEDPVLSDLVRTALANNKDLQISTANVDQAFAQYGIVRSAQFPQVNAGASAARERGSPNAPVPGGRIVNDYVVNLSRSPVTPRKASAKRHDCSESDPKRVPSRRVTTSRLKRNTATRRREYRSSNVRSLGRKTSSVCCSGRIPARSPAVATSIVSSFRLCRADCRQRSSSAVQISGKPNSCSSPPMRTSALLVRHTFPT
jgi:hypothetical protein